MKHLELAEVARMLSSGSPFAEGCRHLAEVCPTCGDKLREVEALMKRFRHWDPEAVVREGPEADGLLATLTAQDSASWSSEVEQKVEYQTWGVAWAALERAQATLSSEAGAKARARDLALLAATIAGHLGEVYHSESVSDLEALAYATAAAAEPPGVGSVDSLRHMATAVAALDRGSGEETVKSEVWDLLLRVLRKAGA
jgi:hypothetical protein